MSLCNDSISRSFCCSTMFCSSLLLNDFDLNSCESLKTYCRTDLSSNYPWHFVTTYLIGYFIDLVLASRASWKKPFVVLGGLASFGRYFYCRLLTYGGYVWGTLHLRVLVYRTSHVGRVVVDRRRSLSTRTGCRSPWKNLGMRWDDPYFRRSQRGRTLPWRSW